MFLICNDSLSVIGPTRVTVSSLDTLPAVGPNRGDSQHGDGVARSITFWFRSLEARNSLEGGFIAVQRSTIEARRGEHM